MASATTKDKIMISIGAVTFGEPSDKNSAGWKLTNIIGKQRSQMLQLVRDNQPLPEPYFLVGQIHGGYERITSEQINWDTSFIKPSVLK